MKLGTKLPLIILPLIAGPILLLGVLVFIEMKASTEEDHHHQIHMLIRHWDNQVNSLIESATSNLHIFADDQLLTSYMLIEDAEERYALLQRPLLRKLASIQRVYPDYYELRVLLPDGYEDVRLVNREVPNLTEEEGMTEYFKRIAGAGNEAIARFAINPDNEELALSVSKPLRFINPATESFESKPALRGYLCITVSVAQLLTQLDHMPWETGGVVLTDEQGRVLGASAQLASTSLAGEAFPMPLMKAVEPARAAVALGLFEAQADEHSTRLTLAGRHYQHHSHRLYEGLWMHVLVPEEVLLAQTRSVGWLALVITLSAMGVALPLLLLVKTHFLKPVERLNDAFAKLGANRELVQVKVQGKDELSALSHSFNRMSLALHESNEQIRNLAFNDSLTGLPNRTMFSKTLKREMSTARRASGRLAVLFLDLDNFKHINDTLGHQAGDQLLAKVAQKVLGNLRSYDLLSRPTGMEHRIDIARLGGDEFTILLSNLEGELTAGAVAQRIIDVLSKPVDIKGSACYVGCSIGIAVYPDDGDNVEDLIKHADLAMYQAKKRGKGNYQYFSSKIADRSRQRARLDQRLHCAVEDHRFELFYQPILDSHSQKIVSLEALIRWEDQELGPVPPDRFIPLAEENGLILPIGAWVLESALRQVKAWQEQGMPTLRVAVNVSGVQLSRPGVAVNIEHLLKKYELSAEVLYIELTETAVLQGQELVLENMRKLHELGVQIALDDFGTGYSSLSYLQNLPIDILKIDRSFIMNLHEGNNGVILSAIITMAHALGMQVVAEGVEDQGQVAFLAQEGCDYLQGYLFSKPRPASEIAALLVNEQRSRRSG